MLQPAIPDRFHLAERFAFAYHACIMQLTQHRCVFAAMLARRALTVANTARVVPQRRLLSAAAASKHTDIKRAQTGPRYSQIVVHNGIVHLAGQVGTDENSDVTAQTKQVALLAAHGH